MSIKLNNKPPFNNNLHYHEIGKTLSIHFDISNLFSQLIGDTL